jgi:hypothetical protein
MTPEPGKLALRVAAVEITLDHLLDDEPGKTVLSLETTLILIRTSRTIAIERLEPQETGPRHRYDRVSRKKRESGR